jgi:hypothetical protein
VKLTKAESTTTEAFGLETFCILTGETCDGLLQAKMRWRKRGSPSSVEFNWQRVWEREEKCGDVVGFYHTHPPGCFGMSARDETTMRAWAFSFGKPMLCAIQVMGAETGMIRGNTEFEFASDRRAMSAEAGEAVLRSWLVCPSGDIVQCPKTVLFRDSWIVAVLNQGV